MHVSIETQCVILPRSTHSGLSTRSVLKPQKLISGPENLSEQKESRAKFRTKFKQNAKVTEPSTAKTHSSLRINRKQNKHEK